MSAEQIMSAGQIYHILSIACYALSALILAVAVYLFFHYRIVNAFNVLSGRKLRQDMNRLKHLSGAASETAGMNPALDADLKSKESKNKPVKQKAAKQEDTEELYRWTQNGIGDNSDTVEMQTGGGSNTEELVPEENGSRQAFGETEELNVVLTDASDTELL